MTVSSKLSSPDIFELAKAVCEENQATIARRRQLQIELKRLLETYRVNRTTPAPDSKEFKKIADAAIHLNGRLNPITDIVGYEFIDQGNNWSESRSCY